MTNLTEQDLSALREACDCILCRDLDYGWHGNLINAVECIIKKHKKEAWGEGYSHGINQHMPRQIITGRRANPYEDK